MTPWLPSFNEMELVTYTIAPSYDLSTKISHQQQTSIFTFREEKIKNTFFLGFLGIFETII